MSGSTFCAMGEGLSIWNVLAVAGDGLPARNDHIVVVLLLCMVGAIVGAGILVRVVTRRQVRPQSAPRRVDPFAAPVSLSIFAAPTRWLAVRSQNPTAVQNAMEVQNVRSCSWGDALATPFEARLFISPPVDGWILVLGADLPDPAADIDECFLFLTRLSQKLGEVQFFTRNRAVAHHGWARLDSGKVIRGYVWAGETLWDQGTPTADERNLKMRCLTYTESSEVLGLGERELLASNTDKVLRLAAGWSLDPTGVSGAILEAKGIAGDLVHWKLH